MEDEKSFSALLEEPETETSQIDKYLSILSQIVLAILIPFIILAVVFSSVHKLDAEYWKKRAEELAKVPQSQALIDLQRQKLMLALEKEENQYKLDLGHDVFTQKDQSGKSIIDLELIIAGKKVLSRFIKSCGFAKEIFANREIFRQRFQKQVLDRAGLVEGPLVDITLSPEILDEPNVQWFKEQVKSIITKLHQNTLELQELIQEGLASYYLNNVAELADENLVEEAQKVNEALMSSHELGEALVSEFGKMVNQFLRVELEKQGVKLLVSEN